MKAAPSAGYRAPPSSRSGNRERVHELELAEWPPVPSGTWRDPDRPPLTSSDDIVERILFWLASLAIVWLVGGLTIAPLLT